MKTLTFILCLLSSLAMAQQESGSAKTTDGVANSGGLELPGWEWKDFPRPIIEDENEKGRVTFTIELNDKGELIRFTKESGTVSAKVERACVDAIKKLTFIKIRHGEAPKVSKGKITFVLTGE